MSNIMVIKQDAKEIIAMLDDADGVMTPEIDAKMGVLMQHGQSGLAILADIRDELALRAKARSDKAAELSALASRDNAMIETAERTMLSMMSALGTKKVEIGSLQITLCDGRESVEIVDEEMVPDTYKKATLSFPASELDTLSALGIDVSSAKVAVSKTAIMETHKDTKGEVGIAGTQIIRKPYLRIKG